MNKYQELRERYRELTTFWNGNVQQAKREQYNILLEILEKLDKLTEVKQ